MKRRIFSIVILLLLGAIVNVAVAWAMYFTNGVGIGSTVTYREHGAEFLTFAHRFDAVGFTGFSYDRIARDPRWPETTSFVKGYNERIAADLNETFLPHIKLLDGKPSPKWFVSTGWPVRTLSASEQGRYFDLLRVPYVPLASGILINTLFYALLLWLLFFAPFTARRMIRRRRGLCEKCAYPVGVSPVCTECGTIVRPSHPRSD